MTDMFWYGVECTAAEGAAADQVLAELGIDPGDDGYGPWDDAAAPPAPRDGLDLSNPSDRDFCRELAGAVAEIPGMFSEAAELYAMAAGVDPGEQRALEFANADFEDVIDLTNAQFDHARAVQADDAAEARIRGGGGTTAHRESDSTEARLARAYARIARGTYDPAGVVEFSSPSEAARELARARWSTAPQGAITGQPNCGESSDDLGYCRNTVHDVTCGSLAAPDVTEALRASGSYARVASRPAIDADRRVWVDQHGNPVTLTGHIEALTGQRQAISPFGAARREQVTPRRPTVFGDPSADPGADPGMHVPRETAATVAAIRAQVNALAPERTAHQRGTRRVADHQGALARAGLVDLRQQRQDQLRDWHAARQHRPAEPVQAVEPWNGSLPAYEAG